MIKLKKDNWKQAKIKDCCDILDNLRKPISAIEREKRIEHKSQSELFPYYGATGVVGWIDDYLIDDEYVLIGEDGAPFFDKSKDIAYLIKGKSWVNNHVHILKAKPKIAYDKFILHYLNSFNDFGGYVNGTTRLKLNKGQLERIPVPLPPLEEQKQIAALFQSIETAMEQVDGQEKNLKSLRKALINKLTKHNLDFGNLLSKSNCREYTIGDLAVEVPDRTDNPQISGIEKFIGLEDFESGELTIQKFSSTEKLVSAMKLCKQGDVLFARRNAYLKRASLTEFDAVCSGDVIVLRANEKIILPKFLVLVMNTVEFWDFAIANAAGTMSKRVKWRDLATYILELPDLKIQEKILELFNQLEKTLSELKQQKTTLKNLKQKLLNEILG